MLITVSGTKTEKTFCTTKFFRFIDGEEAQPSRKSERAEWTIRVSEGNITIKFRDQIFQIPGTTCSITASDSTCISSSTVIHQFGRPAQQNRPQVKNFRIRGLGRHLAIGRTNYLHASSARNESRNTRRRWWRAQEPLKHFAVGRRVLGLAPAAVRQWAEVSSQARASDSDSSTAGPVTPTEPQYELNIKDVEDLLNEYRTTKKSEEDMLEPFHPRHYPEYAHLPSYGAVPALASGPFDQ